MYISCRAGAQLAGTATPGGVAAGDPAFADADVAVREAENTLMELIARLPDRWVAGLTGFA